MSEQPTPKAMTVETHEMIVVCLERELKEARRLIEELKRDYKHDMDAVLTREANLAASLGEARLALQRSEYEKRYMNPGWVERWAYDDAIRQREEARQERDRQTALREAQRGWMAKAEARIKELEAALEEARQERACEWCSPR